MKWISAKREIPEFGVPVLLAVDGVFQPHVFWSDVHGMESFWHSASADERISIEDNHHWFEIPSVN